MIDKTEKVLQVMRANPSWSLVSLQTYKPFYTERFIDFHSDNQASYQVKAKLDRVAQELIHFNNIADCVPKPKLLAAPSIQ